MRRGKFGGFGQFVGAAAALINNTLISIGAILEIQNQKKVIRDDYKTQRMTYDAQLRLEKERQIALEQVIRDQEQRSEIENAGLRSTVFLGSSVSLGLLALLFFVIYHNKEVKRR